MVFLLITKGARQISHEAGQAPQLRSPSASASASPPAALQRAATHLPNAQRRVGRGCSRGRRSTRGADTPHTAKGGACSANKKERKKKKGSHGGRCIARHARRPSDDTHTVHPMPRIRLRCTVPRKLKRDPSCAAANRAGSEERRSNKGRKNSGRIL
jgi:hypothetical protein